MPGKSTYPEPHLSRSMAPVFPANANEIDPRLYRRKPATALPDSVRQHGDSRPRHSGPYAGTGVEPTRYPAPSLLGMELLRIERTLDSHAADARRRDDLPQCRIRA